MGEATPTGLLSGLRVLEIGHFVAAPFCTRLLADLGADVIKIEPPGGDPVRQWGKQIKGHSPGTSSLPPVRVGISIGDSVAGVFAAFGIMAAVWRRDRAGGDRRGRSLDVALTDSILSLMEGMLPEYSALGVVREPTGSRIPTAAPSNAYPTKNDKWILIAANSEPLFGRLARLMERPELMDDPRFKGNQARVAHVKELDTIIANWTRRFAAAEADATLSEADIPCTLVYTAAECAADPQFRQRGMVREVEDPLFGRLLHAGVVPHVPDQPGQVRWPGPPIGAHTGEVLSELLGLGREEIDALRAEGVV
jgi:formyl-CoA transferase